ncbi:MAG: hypothetical protein JEZ00_13655 [Anaerolineaceae bacterium]|nr:hypothetical protein [Anaerolineaceae bacterium]
MKALQIKKIMILLGIALVVGGCQGKAEVVITPAQTHDTLSSVATGTLPGLGIDTTMQEITESPVQNIPAETAETTAEPLANGYLTASELVMMEENHSELDPYQWSSWPHVPEFNPYLRAVHQRGLENGYIANRYSVLGDCQSLPGVFMGMYETIEVSFSEEESHLYETIDYYAGSFTHESLTVIDGLSPPTALSAMWNDPEQCEATEAPLDCEFRLYKPAILFINLGTNWKENASTEAYEKYMRIIIEKSLAEGVIPVLSTKADNIEGQHRINALTAALASEYQIPLWNFWAAANRLENHGLDGGRDSVYLSVDAWALRSRLGLETLDALYRFLGAHE